MKTKPVSATSLTSSRKKAPWPYPAVGMSSTRVTRYLATASQVPFLLAPSIVPFRPRETLRALAETQNESRPDPPGDQRST